MGQHNQRNEPLNQTRPATRYSNQTGANTGSSQPINNSDGHCLDGTHNWAAGRATYGRRSTANLSYRHETIRQ
ncbi:hypothetical protein ACIBCR_15190 [Micromonospora echinospora]|uniref:hypothetical protein n=1 Tax=Micromonospora echinospora TaxID=1877 RepID=UPI00379A2FBB